MARGKGAFNLGYDQRDQMGNTTRSGLVAFLAALALGAGCISKGQAIKNDYYGTIRAVEGARLVSVEHSDPYRWTAELAFDGEARPILERWAAELHTLRFQTNETLEAERVICPRGQIGTDSRGHCEFNAHLHEGEGVLTVTVDAEGPTKGGRIQLTREFEHRFADDPIGPPFPSKPPGPVFHQQSMVICSLPVHTPVRSPQLLPWAVLALGRSFSACASPNSSNIFYRIAKTGVF